MRLPRIGDTILRPAARVEGEISAPTTRILHSGDVINGNRGRASKAGPYVIKASAASAKRSADRSVSAPAGSSTTNAVVPANA